MVQLSSTLTKLRDRWGSLLLLALLAHSAFEIISGSVYSASNEVGTITGVTLMVQVAILTLALSIPLMFDDLDLSVGSVVLLGTMLTRFQMMDSASMNGIPWPSPQPEALPLALLSAALAGAGVGLFHSLLVVGLRLPAVFVTSISGAVLALALIDNKHVAASLGSLERTTTLSPTLLLFGLAGVLLCCFAAVAARQWRRDAYPPQPAATTRERLRALLRGTWLALPLTLRLGLTAIGFNSVSSLLLLFGVAGVTIGCLVWTYRAQSDDERQHRAERHRHIILPLILFVSGMDIALMWREVPAPPLQLLPILPLLVVGTLLASVPVGLALTAVVQALWAGQGRAWIGIDRPPQQAHLARIAALTISSAFVAAVGGCIFAQGTRDGTSVNVGAFYALAPLAGLIIGGQHRLPAALRPLGALLGALVVADFIPRGGVHLEWPALWAVLAAGLYVGLWNLARPSARSASGTTPTPTVSGAPEPDDLVHTGKLA